MKPGSPGSPRWQLPLRDYSMKAAYDEDYRNWWPAVSIGLPPVELLFSGQSVTDVNGVWTRPKVGGHFCFSLGRDEVHGLNRTRVHITEINGQVYKTDNPRPWPLRSFTTTRPDQALYKVPEIEMHYDGPIMMHPVKGWPQAIDGLFASLGVAKTDRIVIVGTGMGFEVASARQLGYAATIGAETSNWIKTADTDDERADLRACLVGAGLDPDVGEGAALLTEWMADTLRNSKSFTLKYTDLSKNGERQQVARAIGGAPDWIISSYVLSVLDDAEALAMSVNMRKFGTGKVVHYTPCLQPDAVQRVGDNWKTASEWKALLSPDLIVSGARYEVL